jgi:hypothetical protein
MGVPTQVKSHPIGLLRHRRIVFIATLGETICAFGGAGWTKVQASVAFPGRQCCLALRVFVRCKVDHGQSWRGLATISVVGAAVLFAAELLQGRCG